MSTTIDNVDYFNGTQKGSGVVIGIDPGIGGIPGIAPEAFPFPANAANLFIFIIL